MGYIYMVVQDSIDRLHHGGSKFFCDPTGTAIEMKTFANPKREPVFRTIRRVYDFLDDWKTSRPDAPLLLSVDLKTAKIIHSYFYEMDEDAYEHFSMKKGEVRKYYMAVSGKISQ